MLSLGRQPCSLGMSCTLAEDKHSHEIATKASGMASGSVCAHVCCMGLCVCAGLWQLHVHG